MGFGFRVCFSMIDAGSLTSEEEFISFLPTTGEPQLRLSASAKGVALGKCNRFSITGRPFQSPEQAQIAADSVRTALLHWAAKTRRGIDLGQNSLKSFGISDSFKQYLAKEIGTDTILEDYLGITVFSSESEPRFVSLNAKGVVSRPAQLFVEDIANAVGRYKLASAKAEIAAELYAISHFANQSPSRFLLLFIALEAIFDPPPRSKEAQAHVNHLIDLTRNSQLTRDEKESLKSVLHFLKQESIAHTGRELAQRVLGENKYDSLTPSQFFAKIYKMRNNIVHRGEIDLVAIRNVLGELDRFVAEILLNQFVDSDGAK